MKKSELLKIIEASGDDDDIDNLLPLKEKKVEIKSDSQIQMTAAEFLQVIKSVQTPSKKEQSGGDDDDEVFI